MCNLSVAFRRRFAGYDLRLAASLGLFLVLVAGLVANGLRPPAGSPYTPESADTHGLLTLRTWFEQLGYQVRVTGEERFDPGDASLLLIYPGLAPITYDESNRVHEWVAAGHTLALIGLSDNQIALASAFGVWNDHSALTGAGLQSQPLLPGPARVDDRGAGEAISLEGAPGAVPVITTEGGQVTAAAETLEQGTAWYISLRHSLDNLDLGTGHDGPLALALLRNVPPGGVIVFDTYHLKLRPAASPAEAQSLRDWLYVSPIGWGLIFGAGALVLGLLYSGMRLGPALPAIGQVRRRDLAEQVHALAALQRRARLAPDVARYYHQRLKTRLARRVRLSPDLPDEDFLAAWAEADETVTPERHAEVARVLAALAALENRADEAELLRLVAISEDENWP